MAEPRVHSPHARPPEVDHDFTSELRQQLTHLVRAQVLHPMNASALPPADPGSMRIRLLTGIQYLAAGTDVLRAYQYDTHSYVLSCCSAPRIRDLRIYGRGNFCFLRGRRRGIAHQISHTGGAHRSGNP